MAATFTRKYKPDAQWLSTARYDVAQFASGCGVEPADVNDIVLAVGEALSNIVEHSGCVQKFTVSCEFDGKRLCVSIEDQGNGFTPPPWPVTKPALGSRGLGLFLINQLMNKVELSTEPGNGAILKLEKLTTR